ncbi:MAG: hypothetical protein LBU83_08640 [Bacteroidales bacterium]|jgi:hypothetical protein|nr:hypothetical protein [Bacteroidales bacterium]
MDKKQVSIWCNELKSAWIAKDFGKIMQIFSETTAYFEDPFSNPGTTVDEIKSYWDEIIYQEINELLIEPIMIKDTYATLHWYLSYKDIRDSSLYVMDGIYLVEFNALFECITFKQWWVIKE